MERFENYGGWLLSDDRQFVRFPSIFRVQRESIRDISRTMHTANTNFSSNQYQPSTFPREILSIFPFHSIATRFDERSTNHLTYTRISLPTNIQELCLPCLPKSKQRSPLARGLLCESKNVLLISLITVDKCKTRGGALLPGVSFRCDEVSRPSVDAVGIPLGNRRMT